MEEAGTPFCISVDGQTAQDNTVTIRDCGDAGIVAQAGNARSAASTARFTSRSSLSATWE